MRLTPWEHDRLTVFAAAELARRRRARGLALTHPEAVAIIVDAMHEAARDGATYADVAAAGRGALTSDDVLPGVRDLLDEVRVEVLLGDGTRVILLADPLAAVDPLATEATEATEAGDPGPGAILSSTRPTAPDHDPDRDRRTLTITNTGRRAIRVTSHVTLDQVNPRLEFDRAAATGFRLDLPAGSSERWAPGETRTVELVRFGGSLGRVAQEGADQAIDGGFAAATGLEAAEARLDAADAADLDAATNGAAGIDGAANPEAPR